MKKIIIVNNNMQIGGIQKSLVNLLKEIRGKYDITLLLLYPAGGLLDELPPDIKLMTGNRFTRIMGMCQAEANKEGALTAAWRALWVIVSRIFGAGAAFGALSRMQKVGGHYDAAVSFMQNSAKRVFYGGCNEFVLNAVKSADKRIAFVHCDFENYEGRNAYNASLYKRFDKIACVSESCRGRFENVCPQSKGKTCTVYNCHDYKNLGVLASEYVPEHTNGVVNIFSAARISGEKGILRTLGALQRLKRRGCAFKWRVAGDGELRAEAERMITELDLENEVELLGMLKNPYPYFQSADLILVPSYNEAAPMVFAEAAYFGVPVLTTDTSSAKELVGERGGGIVCANTDEAIEDALFAILNGETRLDAAKCAKPSNDEAVKQFAALVS